MKHDEANIVIDNVLTNEEIEQLWGAVSNSHGHDFVAIHCQTNNFIDIPQNIVDKFTKYAREISGNDRLVLTEFCHSDYKNREVSGKKYRPSLFPHYDETFKAPRFTLDYQLKGTLDWPIIVEPDIKLVLRDNQAATFSGTNQIHWREPTEFADSDSVEMIFCHFSDPSAPEKDPEVNELMNKKASEYQEWFNANGGFTNGVYRSGRYTNG